MAHLASLKRAFGIACVIPCFVLPAYAAKKKTAEVIPECNYSDKFFSFDPEKTQGLSSNELKSFVAMTTKAKRNVSSSLNEGDVKPDVADFVVKFTNIKNADEIDKLFAEYTPEKMAKASLDLQFFLAQLRPLQSLRGIVWRLTPVVETGGIFSGNKATHSMVVSLLRGASVDIGTYTPDSQWRALFDYVTIPSATMVKGDQFRQMSDFQNYLIGPFYKTLTDSKVATLAVLKKSQEGNEPLRLVWDNKIGFGKGTFDDGIHRFYMFQTPEVLTTLAGIEMAQHSALVFGSFNIDSLPKVVSSLGRLRGLDGFLPGEDLGVSSQDTNRVVLDYARKENYLTIRPAAENRPGGPALMKLAYVHLQYASTYLQNTYDVLQKMDMNTESAFNPLKFQPQLNPLLKSGVDNMSAAVNRKETFRSPVTGEMVTLNLVDFYTKMPATFSLAQFLPTKFDMTAASKGAVKNANGEVLTYTNYRRGAPLAWNNNSWGKTLVPSCYGKSDDDCMKQAARVVRFTPGLEFVQPFFSGFVN